MIVVGANVIAHDKIKRQNTLIYLAFGTHFILNTFMFALKKKLKAQKLHRKT